MPVFVEVEGTANPFPVAPDWARWRRPALGDLDGDGDLDAVVGEASGVLRFLANTGDVTGPAFIERAAEANPFDDINPSGPFSAGYSSPNLVDLDEDGDLDLALGTYYGNVQHFENTGSPAAPAFSSVSMSTFRGIDLGRFSSPALADLDGDGDLDTIVGSGGHGLVYFRSLNRTFEDGFESGDVSAWSTAVPGR